METNQANMGASLKNLETQGGQLAHSMKDNSSISFSSDTKKNPKDCMAITLWSGKKLGNSKEAKNKKIENKMIENKKVVNENVENKKIENEKVGIKKQEVQMDKEEKKE